MTSDKYASRPQLTEVARSQRRGPENTYCITLSGNRYLAVTDDCPIVKASRNRMASLPRSGTSRMRPHNGHRQLTLRHSSLSNAAFIGFAALHSV